MRKYDINRDGQISEEDIKEAGDILEIELREEKAETQKRMAWVALVSMLIFTIGLFSPLVSDSRVHALADLLGLFYIAQAGVVGAYMGVTAWMSSKTSSYSGRSFDSYTPTSLPPKVPRQDADSADRDVVRGRD